MIAELASGNTTYTSSCYMKMICFLFILNVCIFLDPAGSRITFGDFASFVQSNYYTEEVNEMEMEQAFQVHKITTK